MLILGIIIGNLTGFGIAILIGNHINKSKQKEIVNELKLTSIKENLKKKMYKPSQEEIENVIENFKAYNENQIFIEIFESQSNRSDKVVSVFIKYLKTISFLNVALKDCEEREFFELCSLIQKTKVFETNDFKNLLRKYKYGEYVKFVDGIGEDLEKSNDEDHSPFTAFILKNYQFMLDLEE